MESAKAELEKPFAKETELAEKSAHLAQLNAELQFGKDDEVVIAEESAKDKAARNADNICL